MSHRERATTAPSRDSERGQSLALFVGGLVALLIASGFVLDTGISFVDRRDSQNAADLGALAGTHVIAEFHLEGQTGASGSDVHAAIDAAVQANGCVSGGGDACTWTADYVRPTTGYQTTALGAVDPAGSIPVTAQGVAVDITSTPPTYFLRMIGQDGWNVGAQATAISARITDPGPGVLLPFGFDPGPDRDLGGIDLREQYFPDPPPLFVFSEGKDAPGNFSWLSWDDSNDANTLVDSICEADNHAMAFPTYVPGGPGKMNKDRGRDCLDDYIGKTVYVPFWGDGGDACSEGPITDNGSNTDFCILGFAAFELHGRGYGGANQAVDGLYGTLQRFVNTSSVTADFSGPPCNPAMDTSCGSFSSYLGLIR